MATITDYRCALQPNGMWRLSAVVDGTPVVGWSSRAEPAITPTVEANLVATAEQDRAKYLIRHEWSATEAMKEMVSDA